MVSQALLSPIAYILRAVVITTQYRLGKKKYYSQNWVRLITRHASLEDISGATYSRFEVARCEREREHDFCIGVFYTYSLFLL